MKTADIRNMTDDEIRRRVNEAREELMKFRFQLPNGELTDYSQMRQRRQLIAQLLTVLRERERASAQ